MWPHKCIIASHFGWKIIKDFANCTVVFVLFVRTVNDKVNAFVPYKKSLVSDEELLTNSKTFKRNSFECSIPHYIFMDS